MDIRRLTVDDAEEMAAVEHVCFTQPWSLNMCAIELCHDYSFYVGAFDGKKMIGYAGMNIVVDEGHITNVAVLPGYRREGIAKALVGKLLEHDLAAFILEVRESNTGAISLYNSFGFTLIGKRKHYYDKPLEDAYIMIYNREAADEHTGV